MVSTVTQISAALYRQGVRLNHYLLEDFENQLYQDQYVKSVTEIFDKILESSKEDPGLIPLLKPEDKGYRERIIVRELIQKMKYEYALEIVSYRYKNKSQREQIDQNEISQKLKFKATNLKNFIADFFGLIIQRTPAPSIIDEVDGYTSDTVVEVADPNAPRVEKNREKKLEAILDFYEETNINDPQFYLTKIGRMTLKLIAFLAIVYLGADIAAHYFPAAGEAFNAATSLLDKAWAIATTPELAYAGAAAGIASAVAYKWGDHVPGLNYITGFTDSFFKSFTTYEQEIGEAAMHELDARDPDNSLSGRVMRLMR